MRILRLLTVFVIVAVAVGLFAAPTFVESRMNRILQRPPYHVSSATLLLHQQLFVADLHADSLLFGRDLLDRSARGHVDIPRLQQANAALQVFSVVTKVPRRLNIEHNSDGSDEIRALAILDRWPPRTWNSLVERALYQAERLIPLRKNRMGPSSCCEAEKISTVFFRIARQIRSWLQDS
jgi:membrane dipeptidase